MERKKTDIKALYSGKVETIDDGKRRPYSSAYKKQKLDPHERYFVNTMGFENDMQGDRVNHGGEDKAVCVYSEKDYGYFRKTHNLELPECAFGENITIVDMDDSDISIGDRFQCGEVIFEVSQPRQPCWKISSVIGIKKLTAFVVRSHKTGFYLRVLKEGSLSLDDSMELIARPYPKFTIEFVNQCAFNAKENQENIQEILSCCALAKAYHESLSKRLKYKEQGIQEWQEDEYASLSD